MESNMSDFSYRVCLAVKRAYNSMNKTGKPQEGREWTLLAGFLTTDGEFLREQCVCSLKALLGQLLFACLASNLGANADVYLTCVYSNINI